MRARMRERVGGRERKSTSIISFENVRTKGIPGVKTTSVCVVCVLGGGW